MKKVLLSIASLALLLQTANAQNPEWIYYPQGGNIWALSIELDSNGRTIVWMRGGPGVTKFDGTNWTVYDSTVTGFRFAPNSIRFDSKGNVWMGNTTGLVKYDRKNWTIYNTSNSQAPSDVLPHIDISPDDLIIIGSPVWRKAYYEFDGIDKWTIFDSTQIPSQLNVWNVMYERGTQNRWLANRGFVGAVLYDGNEFIIHSTTNSGISSNTIFGLAIDKHHNKYFGPEYVAGISVLDSTNTVWTVHGYDLYAAYDMAFHGDTLWWVVPGPQALGGLFRATKDFKDVRVWNATNSPLVSAHPRRIAIDSNGNKWIGTDEGLLVFNEGGIVNIDDNNFTVPGKFVLHQNYPNPFNPVTTIKYDLYSAGTVKLGVYDINGKLIKMLVNGRQSAGSYSLDFDGSELSSGVYFYELFIEDTSGYGFRDSKKMLLIK